MKVRKVKVLGRTYKVKYMTKAQIIKNVGYHAYGYCDNENEVIVVDKELGEKMKLRTFKHEVCHAAMHVVGLDQVISSELQEILAETFSNLI